MPLSVRRLLVILAVAGAGFVPAPASAAYCSGTGVNVVVDYGPYGGVTKECGSGTTAAAVFSSAGISLTRDQRYNSVVCKVEGVPSDANCVTMPAADAYWGLFWSDGSSAHWVYSTINVDALKVPSGGFVGFAWQSSSSQRPPSATPSNPQAQPSPTPTKATTSPTKKPAPRPTVAPSSGAPSASASVSSTPSAVPSATLSSSTSSSATAAGGGSPTTDVSPPADAAGAGSETIAAKDDGGGGLPWWVPVAVLVGLAGGGAAARWRRRRSTA